ncbi:DNA-binding protein [Maribellus luteus]|uniref:DNA-binding protein n=2 Tax=Maribellus luteus TaxID=2305463 RepID=A0A399T7X3_9BACT|nr:DNA-binding protein [Maribellus luteus]
MADIKDYNIDTKLFYLETLYARDFIIQDNEPSKAPDITKEFKNWVSKKIVELQILQIGRTTTNNNKREASNNVFIVHGHNNETKLNVARTVEQLGLVPIILHERPNEGKTIIEKFEKNSDVGFAIVLINDDDLGKSKNELEFNCRARQNVILELGYFIGKLGRDRVCPLYSTGVELPSDIQGLMYIELDKSDMWKYKLAKELKTAGYEIDTNKIT